MSLYDYQSSLEIESKGYSFHALVMAAMRQADTRNDERLRLAFPTLHRELHRRYNAAGGRLPEDDTPAEAVIVKVSPSEE